MGKITTLNDLYEAVQIGFEVDVEFNTNISSISDGQNMRAGMRAVVNRIDKNNTYDMLDVYFDYTKYDEYNEQYEERIYHDENGNPCLTAREAGCYSIVENLYFECSQNNVDLASLGIVVRGNSAKFYDEFWVSKNEDGFTGSYVQYLEDTLIKYDKMFGLK